MRLFPSVDPTAAEVDAAVPGDDLVLAEVVMDRGFDLPAPPADVWPWLVQLGKGRAGWYFPAWFERFVPPARRGYRRIDPALLDHRVGSTVPDWGGRDATLTLVASEEPRLLLHRTQRGRLTLTWALVLTPSGPGSRVHSRVRLGPVRHRRIAEVVGGAFDEATIAGLAAGLRERVSRG